MTGFCRDERMVERASTPVAVSTPDRPLFVRDCGEEFDEMFDSIFAHRMMMLSRRMQPIVRRKVSRRVVMLVGEEREHLGDIRGGAPERNRNIITRNFGEPVQS